jgi:hypothetical protein
MTCAKVSYELSVSLLSARQDDATGAWWFSLFCMVPYLVAYLRWTS